MDPKALSHLDPKARETYDRIMGTAATTDPTTNQAPPQSADVPSQDMADANQSTTYNSDLGQIIPTSEASNSGPDQAMNPDTQGTSPSIFSTPSPSDMTTPSVDAGTETPSTPNSSFFINPSPSSSDMSTPSETPQSFAPVEPPQDPTMQPVSDSDPLSPITPVTPYAPESAAPVDATADEPFAQPLPSPAEVNQQVATHETSPLLKVLYIVGAVIFFAIYTIFWIKVFNLPFLF